MKNKWKTSIWCKTNVKHHYTLSLIISSTENIGLEEVFLILQNTLTSVIWHADSFWTSLLDISSPTVHKLVTWNVSYICRSLSHLVCSFWCTFDLFRVSWFVPLFAQLSLISSLCVTTPCQMLLSNTVRY